MEMEDNHEREVAPAAGEGEGFSSLEIPYDSATAAAAESANDSVDQVIIFNRMVKIPRI